MLFCLENWQAPDFKRQSCLRTSEFTSTKTVMSKQKYPWDGQSSGFVKGKQKDLRRYQKWLCLRHPFSWKALSWPAVCIFFFCQESRAPYSISSPVKSKATPAIIPKYRYWPSTTPTPGLHVFSWKHSNLGLALSLESLFVIFVAAAVSSASLSLW